MTQQPIIQNFSVPADNDHDVYITINSNVAGDTLDDCTVYFNVYEQAFGAPVPDVPPIITKTSLSGGGVTILPSPPLTVRVSFVKTETAALLRNYCYEATVVDGVGNVDTVTTGIMTVTGTENRP